MKFTWPVTLAQAVLSMENQDQAYRLTIRGATEPDVEQIRRILNVNPQYEETSPPSRDASAFLSAAFVLGVLNATPAIVNALTDLLARMRQDKYFTFRLTSFDDRVHIEGAATPERILELKQILGSSANTVRGQENLSK